MKKNPYTVALFYYPVSNIHGEIIEYLYIMHDITQIFQMKEKIEDEKKVKFNIDTESQSIELFSPSWELVWYIKPGTYTYGNVSQEKHLERKVYDEFTWNWFWQLLFDIYSGLKLYTYFII